MVRRAALVTAAVATLAGCGAQRRPSPSPVEWSHAVTRICARALLFEGRHEIGTRSGAVAVGRDIRASTTRRLVRVAELPLPAAERSLIRRWLSVERRLAHTYADAYVRIFEVIDAARTPAARGREPVLLQRLVHSPDQLRETAARLERRLAVPDCTGGVSRAPTLAPAAGPVEAEPQA